MTSGVPTIVSINLMYFIASYARLKALVRGLAINKTCQMEALVPKDQQCYLNCSSWVEGPTQLKEQHPQ